MRIMCKHLVRYVSGYRHNGLVTRLGLSEFCNGVLPEVVEPESIRGTFDFADVSPALLVATDLSRVL